MLSLLCCLVKHFFLDCMSYLNLDVANLIAGPDDWATDHRRENVCGKIAAGITAFDEL